MLRIWEKDRNDGNPGPGRTGRAAVVEGAETAEGSRTEGERAGEKEKQSGRAGDTGQWGALPRGRKRGHAQASRSHSVILRGRKPGYDCEPGGFLVASNPEIFWG